jgi:predicted enzyme related to lactoylglutathione lyase
MGDGFRWVTVGHPGQPELEVTLMVPGPPLDPEMAGAIERSLAKGTMGGFGLHTDDCQKTYEELSAQGIEFTQPPSERPYGVEALLHDNTGNWLVLVEPREYSAEDFSR